MPIGRMSSPLVTGEEMSSWLDPIEADAERVRLSAGIRPEVAVPDLEAAFGALGLTVATRPLGRGRPEAVYTGHGVALLNPSGLPARTRFVAAHLLAHHLYGDEPHVEREVERDLERPGCDDRQRRASGFAARFLVGREALWARAPARITAEAVLRLAAEFQVGYEVMLRRLRDTGLIEPEGWSEMDDVRVRWPTSSGHNGVGRHARPPHPGR
ncbi:MAG TPA: ImmA/IrrE family metallo-endopeptidase [Candidatus Dormibacteraeota bacterium]|nr:ImmA/IrrE family metallo-endopeptidase [Candidatus Dormibacteraeota bacterium]